MKKLTREASISAVLIIMAILTFASKGGGGDKKNNNNSFRNNFTPIRSATSFTLKSSPSYNGTYIYNQHKESNKLSFNAMVTYEQGNTTYILPYKYKVPLSSFNTGSKTNLQILGVKIKMPK
jgi:hypothetical protein